MHRIFNPDYVQVTQIKQLTNQHCTDDMQARLVARLLPAG
jgi:hypothetical protein